MRRRRSVIDKRHRELARKEAELNCAQRVFTEVESLIIEANENNHVKRGGKKRLFLLTCSGQSPAGREEIKICLENREENNKKIDFNLTKASSNV